MGLGQNTRLLLLRYLREKSTLYSLYANKNQITAYLGWVNFVSLFPSALLLGGALTGAKKFTERLRDQRYDVDQAAFRFFFIAIIISAMGYAWFLIKYPVLPKGTTIKATYMIQIFVLLPFLTAEFLEFIREKNVKTYHLLLVLLGVVFVHNLPAMISRYWWWLR